MIPRTGAEARVVAWAAATFGCLLAATFVIRPVRDALVLDGKPDQLPWLFTANLVAMLVLAPLWGTLIGRASRGRFVTIAFHATAACLVGFIALAHSGIDPVVIGRIFYIWAGVVNLFVVSVFWSVCADVLGPDTARRLYGPIAVGGTIGAVVGPLLASALVGWFEAGVEAALIAAACLVELAVFGVLALERAGRDLGDTADAATTEPVAGGALDGLRDVGRSSYLGGISAYVLFTACAATFVYLEQADIVQAALPDRDARTEYFANVDLLTNAGVLVVQAVATGPVLRCLGVGLVLAILPMIQGVGIIALLAAPSLAMLVAVQVTSRVAQHALIRPARELLFTVVPRDQKYRAKNVIDTLIYRTGDVGSSWLRVGLVSAGFGGLALLGVALPLAALWLATSIYLGVGFRRRHRPTPPAKDDA